jgi:hypothetical protein
MTGTTIIAFAETLRLENHVARIFAKHAAESSLFGFGDCLPISASAVALGAWHGLDGMALAIFLIAPRRNCDLHSPTRCSPLARPDGGRPEKYDPLTNGAQLALWHSCSKAEERHPLHYQP